MKGFTYDKKNDDFYNFFIDLLSENGASKESYLCARQLLDQGQDKQYLYIYAGKSLIKEGRPDEAQKVLLEGL